MRLSQPLLLVFALVAASCGGSGESNTSPGSGSWIVHGLVTSDAMDVDGVFLSLSGDRVASTTTDIDGRFTFVGVPNGAYRVTPQAGGASFTPNYYELVIAGQQPTAVNFMMRPLTDPSPPDEIVRLVLVHHDTGANWLDDEYGNLAVNLQSQNFFVSDVTYGWSAPENPDIGDETDIGQYWSWFADTSLQNNGTARRTNITQALYETEP